MSNNQSRRLFLATASAALVTPALLRAQNVETPVDELDVPQTPQGVRRNASSFQYQQWQDHFDTLGVATVVADTTSRALHYWNSDGSDYRVFATSVPRREDLTKRGYTKIVRKRVGPDWTPTANMIAEDPDLSYMPPGPGNPLGTHAMYLSWPAYLIHGTHDTRKIGRRSSSGCIGLYNEQIAQLFELCPVGTQVRVI
ncbi:L,D-transpeptidase catalytic domain [Litoreibacter ascidiaceicola]|uniref:L,D-transpeptidase catalytic domain n=1 Tax=Litoreibacter ascidiaceicola TaxID=1486859 RepID=A0A1M4V6Y3_9RHOB|nr:L,D-transpeptidase [Litoreibacter ascidiaceicola]SHE64623.1 L,D-transpeptidase catalytic domain [Litoreibacter ascidiaceicola]